MVDVLIANGADVNAKVSYDKTPLLLHAMLYDKTQKIAKLLIAKGADINARDKYRRTPLIAAFESNKIDIVKLLIAKGADGSPQKFPSLSGDYLGQEPPGTTPEIFAPGIVSTEKTEHSFPAFSPDGKEVYWSVWMGVQKIFFMKQENGKWTTPQVAPFSGRYNDGNPCFPIDGKKLFFSSNRPAETGGKTTDLDIWIIEKNGTEWSEPHNAGSQINTENDDRYPTVTRDETLYFESGSDIYYSRLINGSYTKAENPGTSINTGFMEGEPYIDSDETYLIFNSNRPGGSGFISMYISYRYPDDSWTEATLLQDKIKTNLSGRFPFVSLDGKYFFFGKNYKFLQ